MDDNKKLPLGDVAELARLGEEATGTSKTADTSVAPEVAAKDAAKDAIVSNIMMFLQSNADDAGNAALNGSDGNTDAFKKKLNAYGHDDLLSINELLETEKFGNTKVLKYELAQAIAGTGLNQNPMEVAALNAEIGKIDTIEALHAFLANPDRVKNLTMSQFLLVGAKQYVLTHPVAEPVEAKAEAKTEAAPVAEALKPVEIKIEPTIAPVAPTTAPTIDTNENANATLVMAEELLADGTSEGVVETAYEQFSTKARLFGTNAKLIATELNKLNGETAHLTTKAFNEDLAVELDALNQIVDATSTTDLSDANAMLNQRMQTAAAFERVTDILAARASKIVPASARATQSLIDQTETIDVLKADSKAFVTEMLYTQALNSPAYNEMSRAVRPFIAKRLNKKAAGTPDQMYQLVSEQIAKFQKRPDGIQIMQGMMEKDDNGYVADYFKQVTPFEKQTPQSEAKMDSAMGKLAQIGREALAAPSLAHTAKQALEAAPAAEPELSDNEKFMNLMKDRARSHLRFGATDAQINAEVKKDLEALQSDTTGNGANLVAGIMLAATGDKNALKAFKKSLVTGTDTTRDKGLRDLVKYGRQDIAKKLKAETPRIKPTKAEKAAKKVAALTDNDIHTIEQLSAFSSHHLSGTEAPQEIGQAQATIDKAYADANDRVSAILAAYKRNMPKADIAALEAQWNGLKTTTAEGSNTVNDARALSDNRANTVYMLNTLLNGMDAQQVALEKAMKKKKPSSAATKTAEATATPIEAELEALKALPALRAELKAAQGNYLESQMLANPEFKAKSEKMTAQLTQAYQDKGATEDAAKEKAANIMRDLAKNPEADKLANRLESGLNAKQAFKDGTNTPDQQADAEQAESVVAAYQADNVSPEKRWMTMQQLGGRFTAPKVKVGQKFGKVLAAIALGTAAIPAVALYVLKEKYPTMIVTGIAGYTKTAVATAAVVASTTTMFMGMGLGGLVFANLSHHYSQARKQEGTTKLQALGKGLQAAAVGLADWRIWGGTIGAPLVLPYQGFKAYKAMRAQEDASGEKYGFMKKIGVSFTKLNENAAGRAALGAITGGLGALAGEWFRHAMEGTSAVATGAVGPVPENTDTATAAAAVAGAAAGKSVGMVPHSFAGTGVNAQTLPTSAPTAALTGTPTAAPAPMPAPVSAGVPTVPVAPTTSGQGWDIFGFRQQVKALSDLKDLIIKNVTPDLGSDDVMRNNEAVSIAKALNSNTPSTTPKGAYMDKLQKDYAGVKPGTNQPQGARPSVPMVTPLPETPEGIAAAIQKGFPTQAGAVTVQPNGDITAVFPSTEKANLAAQKMMAGRGMFKVPHSIQINESGQMIIKPNLSGVQNGMNVQSGPAPQPTSYAVGGQAEQGAARARWEQNGLPTFKGNTVVESNTSAPYFPQNGAGASRAAFLNSASTVSTVATPPSQPVTVYYTGQQPGVQPLPASKYIPTR